MGLYLKKELGYQADTASQLVSSAHSTSREAHSTGCSAVLYLVRRGTSSTGTFCDVNSNSNCCNEQSTCHCSLTSSQLDCQKQLPSWT